MGLKTVLVQAAWGATRAKDSNLRGRYRRLKTRRGPKKAILAVAGSILTAACHTLRDGTAYEDLGGDYFDRADGRKRVAQVYSAASRLGYGAELRDAA